MPKYTAAISEDNFIVIHKDNEHSLSRTYRRVFKDPVTVFFDYFDLIARWYAENIRKMRNEVQSPYHGRVISGWEWYELTQEDYDLFTALGEILREISLKWLDKDSKTQAGIEILLLIEYLQPLTLIREGKFDELKRRINEYLLRERI